MEEVEPGRMVRLEGRSPEGVVLRRTLLLDDRYLVSVADVFSNATREVISLPEHSIELGVMQDESGGQAPRGVVFLGVDAQLHGGRGVQHFGKKQLPNAAKRSADGTANFPTEGPVDWLAAKTRYFTQILRPEDDTVEGRIFGAKQDPRDRILHQVSGDIVFPSITLEPGQSFQRTMSYYAGPKRFSVIRELRNNQAEVMEFGLFSPICKFLLWTLNLIHDRLWPHNYGLAIILLTIIIRGIFWPITHKSTESMRKMQELAPVLQEVKAKYKDNPQKQQQAMMEIYRENKVNPLGGCMPMLVQIPVFFALFVVLRSASELRFAGFLWVRDLSEPENLLAGVLPFGLSLNILPILNAASMGLQQKLTPATGDPRQANMMKFMPIMMLVLFYNFASGLVLYWTTNQVVMMTQQVLYHRRREKQKTAA
jgi:YidC/Oxa1 family membrane protein insertase